MKKIAVILVSIYLAGCLFASSNPKGYLFIIGGGSRPESMMKRFIELAERHHGGKIIILPMASSVPDEVGPKQRDQLKSYGAKNVEFHILTREQAEDPESVRILDEVGGIFFSGGVQTRLAAVLRGTPFHERLLEIYEKGGVIGGTSAGAAVMSEIMITGEEKQEKDEGHKFETILASNIITEKGFGFIKDAVIDQHFVERKRHNRLISVVAENPNTLGIGIGESTAVLVNPDQTFEVIGKGNAIIYDASKAHIDIHPSQSIRGYDITMHILAAGDRFDLKAKQAIR